MSRGAVGPGSATTARNPSFRWSSFRCDNCSITTNVINNFRCLGCHRDYVQVRRSPSSQTPLHISNYIESDNDDLFYSILNRIANASQDQEEKLQSRTSKSFIDSLQFVKVTDSCLKSFSKTCSICQDEYDGGSEQVTQLPCKHVFHHDCIVPWLNRSNSCPLCRYKLPAPIRYTVRMGNLYVGGWSEDLESVSRDAERWRGLLFEMRTHSRWHELLPEMRPHSRQRQSSFLTPMGRSGRGSWGSVEREDHVVGAARTSSRVGRSQRGSGGTTSSSAYGRVTAMVDEDGDTLMVDEDGSARGLANYVGAIAMLDEDGDAVMLDP